jgi:hypothetical protein
VRWKKYSGSGRIGDTAPIMGVEQGGCQPILPPPRSIGRKTRSITGTSFVNNLSTGIDPESLHSIPGVGAEMDNVIPAPPLGDGWYQGDR